MSFQKSAEGALPRLRKSSRGAHQVIPRHGCMPREPAAVWPGKIIVGRLRPCGLLTKLLPHLARMLQLAIPRVMDLLLPPMRDEPKDYWAERGYSRYDGI